MTILTLGACLMLSNALAQQPTPRYVTHLVRKGETLDQISKWTGVPKKQIIFANNLYSKKFHPGMVLAIPVPKPTPRYDLRKASGFAPYTLRAHDRAANVAAKFHMTPQAVKSLNPSIAWAHPKAGAEIRIPMRNAFIYKLAALPDLSSHYAYTTRPNTIVRALPGSRARRVVEVQAGRHVKVLAQSDYWYKVKFEYGTIGWVRGDLLRAAPDRKVYAKAETKSTPRRRSSGRVAYHASPNRVRGVRNNTGPLPTAGDMLAFAKSLQGTPYRYGAASRHATDCSGYTLQVLKHEGIKLPRTAAEQSHKGRKVTKDNLKPGDLVFFHTSRGSRISHVGIYMGNGKFIHASSGGGKVQVNSLKEGYYKKRFATARRVAKVTHKETAAEKLARTKKEDESAMKKAEQGTTTPVGADGK